MKITNNNIFYKMYPHLDLHNEYASTADLIIKEFIRDNYKLGKEKIVIVHGIGTGTIKRLTHEILSKSLYVEKYYLDINNTGTTIIELKKVDKYKK